MPTKRQSAPSHIDNPHYDTSCAAVLSAEARYVLFRLRQSGMGEFLTELRPSVALFVRFGGIDYDNRRRHGKISPYAGARVAMGMSLLPSDQARLDEALAPARQSLGDQAEVIWNDGMALPLERAIDQVYSTQV